MKIIYKHIDKTIIPTLPLFSFEGRIEVIDTEKAALRALSMLKKHRFIGIDTETRPSFKKGVIHHVALLQLSTEEVCYLFRLNKIGMMDSMIDLFADKRIFKIGLALDNDLRTLKRLHSFTPRSFIDLQNFAHVIGIEDQSLQKLFANVFGKHISKGARLSNWESEALTESQQKYAATDAYTCLILYKEIKRLHQTQDFILQE